MVEKVCPYRYEHCATYSREELYDSQESDNQPSNITKVFVKGCALDKECSKPSPCCKEQGTVSGSCSHVCCHGHLCNTGKSTMVNVHGSLALLLAVVLAIMFSSQMNEARSENCDAG